MTKLQVLQQAQRLGLNGVGSADGGHYTCHECGNTWTARERWLWWPIRIHWSTQGRWFHRHGIESFADGIEQRTYQQVWHFGRLRVILGRDSHTSAP